MIESQSIYTLTILEGPNAGQSYPLQSTVYTLGRTADNTIMIDSPRISRHHAQLRPVARGFEVEDLGSTNGTWVNDKRLTAPHRLKSGDKIALADYITFRIDVEDATERMPTSTMPNIPSEVSERTPPSSLMPGDIPASPPLELTPVTPSDVPPASRESLRPSWQTAVIVLLVVLILLCLGLAAYLWFAPYEFWVKVFEFFSIPLPGVFC